MALTLTLGAVLPGTGKGRWRGVALVIFSIAFFGLICGGFLRLGGPEAINSSWPDFLRNLALMETGLFFVGGWLGSLANRLPKRSDGFVDRPTALSP